MTEQYAFPTINLADTRPGIPGFSAREFDAVNPVGTVDTTGARFATPGFQGGIDYVLPPVGDPGGDAGQIIFTKPGIYQVNWIIGPIAGATAVGITWVEPDGSRPALNTDPATGISTPPSDFVSLQAYAYEDAGTVLTGSGLLRVTPQVSVDFPLVAVVNITAAAASSATPTFTQVDIFRIAPFGS